MLRKTIKIRHNKKTRCTTMQVYLRKIKQQNKRKHKHTHIGKHDAKHARHASCVQTELQAVQGRILS